MKYCAVPTCGNTYKCVSGRCSTHNCSYGTGPCACNPPLQFFPFPSRRKDREGRRRWVKLVKRRWPNGESWQPDLADHSGVCSEHFPNGQPTAQNPDPVLKLGDEPPTGAILSPPKKQRADSKSGTSLATTSQLVPASSVCSRVQLVHVCPYATGEHQASTNTPMTAGIIPRAKPKPDTQGRICFACQRVSKYGRSMALSKKGRLDLHAWLKQYLNLEVDEGWMCKRCIRQLQTIVKKVNAFRSSVLAGQRKKMSRISLQEQQNGMDSTESPDKGRNVVSGDIGNKHQHAVADCHCSNLLQLMRTSRDASEPLEGKTKVFPNQTPNSLESVPETGRASLHDLPNARQDHSGPGNALTARHRESVVFPKYLTRASGPVSESVSTSPEKCPRSPVTRPDEQRVNPKRRGLPAKTNFRFILPKPAAGAPEPVDCEQPVSPNESSLLPRAQSQFRIVFPPGPDVTASKSEPRSVGVSQCVRDLPATSNSRTSLRIPRPYWPTSDKPFVEHAYAKKRSLQS